MAKFDEAQALDFGIYRIIRHRNRAVRQSLGKIEAKDGDKTLEGGELQKILDRHLCVQGRRAIG